MIVSIASGKGGTGKTTVSSAIALASSEPVFFLDCDVEEPNAHFFLSPVQCEEEAVFVPIPEIDLNRCTGCRKCAEICQFKAIIVIGKQAMIFQELCHSCGGCALICPAQAIAEKPFPIGKIKKSQMKQIRFIQGELKVGQAMSPPMIRAVKKYSCKETLTIIDCPPGNSCPMTTAVKGSDYVLLVTEPTPFGLHDLKLAVETIRKMNLPFGIIINRFDSGDNRIENYALKEKIEVLMRIPDDRKVAEAYSNGIAICDVLPEIKDSFNRMIKMIMHFIQMRNKNVSIQ